MLSIASQINANHFIILVLCILSICTLIAYANAKIKLFAKLKTASIAYAGILIFSIGVSNHFDMNIANLEIQNPMENTVSEKTNEVSGNLVMKILELVKKAF
jgi:hypothetical protein